MRPRDTKPMGYGERLFWFGLLALACVLILFLAALIYSTIADSLKGYFTYWPTMVQEMRCLA